MSSRQSTHRDPYQEVTDRITAALERGTVPWHRPWAINVGAPRSIDERFYNGVNALLLGLSEFGDPRWGTFNAVKSHGGNVRKGERGTFVVFFNPLEIADSEGGEKRTVPMLRYFYVFNVEQWRGGLWGSSGRPVRGCGGQERGGGAVRCSARGSDRAGVVGG